MRVLILGGTGAMGVHLAQLLLQSGADVSVTSRSRQKAGGAIRHIQGDAHDPEFSDRVLAGGYDAVVDFMVYDTKSFGDRLPKLLASTNQYVFISSARVYAESQVPITEDMPRLLDSTSDADYLSTDEYALTKARQEDLLLRSGKLNWTIVRPYITYGERRLQLGVFEKEGWLYRAIQGRSIVFSASIAERLTTLTYGLDVARSICAIIGSDGALGQAFHTVGGRPIRWKQALSIYLDALEGALGVRPEVVLADDRSFETMHSAQYQIKYDRMFDRVFDASKIGGYLPVDDFTPPEIGLRSCVEQFLASPGFASINWRSEALKDRFCGQITPFREIEGGRKKLRYFVSRYL